MSASIVVIGSANIDLIMQAPRLPGVGETVTDCTFAQAFGGKGANQAVAAARAGAAVTFVAALGNDPYAATMIASYQAGGICTDWIVREDDLPTGSALIMFDQRGENYITVAPGANYRLTPARVQAAEAAIAACDWLIMQMEIPTETICAALALAQKHGKPVLHNYAPIRDQSVPLTSAIHGLVVNEQEAAALAGCEVPSAASDQAAALASTLRSRGGHAFVVLTLGQDGAVIATTEGLVRVPALPVQAVDTTAAGDTFCGALAVALAEGRALAAAARFASAAAALAVTRIGAQPSIPLRADIDALAGRHG